MGKLDDAKLSIDQNISSNGNEEITGGTLNAVLNEVVDATKGAITDTTLSFGQNILNLRNEVFPKLTQLSQEFEEIKNADFTLNPHIEMVEPTETALAIEPDKFYKWGEVASLALALNPQTSPRYAGQYFFQFTCPTDAATSLSLPIGLIWSAEPKIEAGKTYQVSILENLAILISWTISLEE